MKKQVLLSVFAAALFAAPAVSAFDLPNVKGVGTYGDTDKPVENLGELKASADKYLGDKSEKLTRDANVLKQGETLKVDKGQATKAADKAVKALPRTSAVK